MADRISVHDVLVGLLALQEARIAPDRLVAGVAGNALEGRIDVDEGIVEFRRVGDQDALGGRFQRAVSQPQAGFRPALLGVGRQHEGHRPEKIGIGFAERAHAVGTDDQHAGADRLFADRHRDAGAVDVLQARNQVEVPPREVNRHVGAHTACQRWAIVQRHSADVDRLLRPARACPQPQHALVGRQLHDTGKLHVESARDQLDRHLIELVARDAL